MSGSECISCLLAKEPERGVFFVLAQSRRVNVCGEAADKAALNVVGEARRRSA